MFRRQLPRLGGHAPVLLAFLAVFATGLIPLVRPLPALACTGSTEDLLLDRYVAEAEAIAVVYVDSVGGPDNMTPPLPPGTQPEYPGAGTWTIREDFDFEGYGVNATVLQVLAGDLPPSIEFDWQLRADMEATARQAEVGGVVPCFFGWQDRFQAGRDYLVLLDHVDGGWQTLDAYEIRHALLAGNPSDTPEVGGGALFVSGDLYARFFSGIAATRLEGTPDGLEAWRIDQVEVPLQPVFDAIAALAGQSQVRPPSTGNAGLAGQGD